MAPEQIRGDDVDHRADFCHRRRVLSNCSPAERRFEGDSIPTTLYKVLETQPPAGAPARATSCRRRFRRDRTGAGQGSPHRFQTSGEMLEAVLQAHGRTTPVRALDLAHAAIGRGRAEREIVPPAPRRSGRAFVGVGHRRCSAIFAGSPAFALLNQRTPETARPRVAQPEPASRPNRASGQPRRRWPRPLRRRRRHRSPLRSRRHRLSRTRRRQRRIVPKPPAGRGKGPGPEPVASVPQPPAPAPAPEARPWRRRRRQSWCRRRAGTEDRADRTAARDRRAGLAATACAGAGAGRAPRGESRHGGPGGAREIIARRSNRAISARSADLAHALWTSGDAIRKRIRAFTRHRGRPGRRRHPSDGKWRDGDRPPQLCRHHRRTVRRCGRRRRCR